MKTIKPYLLLFFLFAPIFSANIKAAKIIGGEMSYEYINKDVYSVNLKIYTECGGGFLCTGCPNTSGFRCLIGINIRGAEAPAGANIPPNPYAGQSFGTQRIPPIPGLSGKEVTQLCPQVSSKCTNCGQQAPGNFSPGIEVYQFSGTVDLTGIPDSCCWVTLSFDTCCRNNNISTLIQTNPQNFYIQVNINRCLSPGNSAPVFTNAPVFLACAGQDYSYNLGAIDPDGDSLSYALGSVSRGPSLGMTYKPPFSETVPFPYLGYPAVFNESQKPLGLHLNGISGNIWFKPIDTFTGYLSIDVLAWRRLNGVPTLNGISTREIQIFSKNCPSNTAPNILVYDKNGQLKTDDTFEICAGNEICFNIAAKDGNTLNDSTFLSFPSHRINPITPTIKKYYADSLRPRHDSMQICWTPTSAYARFLPFYLTIAARDNSCPFPLQSSKTIAIYVRNKPTANISKINLSCGYYSFSYIQSSTVPLDTNFTQYSIETTPKSNTFQLYRSSRVINHRFTQAGWHRIRLSLTALHFDSNEACASEVWDSVWIWEPIQVKISSKICSGADVKIKVSGSGGTPLGPSYRYTFYTGKFGSNQVIRNFGPDSNFLLQSTHLQNSKDFYVVVQDLNGCKDSLAFEVDKDDVIKPDAMKIYDFCNSSLDSISINPIDTGIHIHSWTYQNQVIDSAVSKIMPRGAGYYYINKSKQQSCWVTDTIKVMHSPPFTNTLEKIIKDSCAGNISLTSKTAWGWSHQWFKDFEPIATEKRAVLYPKESGTYHVLATDRGLCTKSSDTITLTVYPKPILMAIWGPTFKLDTSNIFNYYTQYVPQQNYMWYLTNATAQSRLDSNAILVKFKNYGSASLIVQSSNEYGCTNHTSFPVYVDWPSVGLNQTEQENPLSIYPNPAFEYLDVYLEKPFSMNDYTITMMDALGNVMLVQKMNQNPQRIYFQEAIKEGLYLIKITGPHQEDSYLKKVMMMPTRN